MVTIPTISQIRDQIIADIEGKIGQTIPSLAKAFFRVLATALAGVLALLYRFGAWTYNQIFPQTADFDALKLIGEQYGIIPTAAVASILEATATGASDTTIPAGTLWTANGIVYQQTNSVDIVGGTATIEVEALTSGAIDAPDELSLSAPIAGVDSTATVTTETTSGEDPEDIEDFRVRVLQRLQQRPQGGAVSDWVGWALEVPGIVKAFAFNTDPGEVTVYPLVALSGTRIPDGSKLTEVDTYLEDPDRKPLCATVVTAAMTEREITVDVSSITPDNPDLRDAVEAAWSAYLLRAFPLQYADDPAPTNVVSLAGLYAEAIGAGALALTATMQIDGTPGDIEAHTLDDSEIIKLGTVTWP